MRFFQKTEIAAQKSEHFSVYPNFSIFEDFAHKWTALRRKQPSHTSAIPKFIWAILMFYMKTDVRIFAQALNFLKSKPIL